MTEAHHPGDGAADPAGRIVFGRLERVDEFREQLVTLYAIDPDGSDLVRLLDCEVARPRFSPDGSRIAFGIAMVDGTMQVATMAADGTDLRILTNTAGFADTPDWSPDGTWLVFAHSPVGCASATFDACTKQEGMHQTLWRTDADGSNQAAIGNPDTYDWEPRLAPDGGQVVFTRIDVLHDDWFSPMIRDLATGVERPLTSDASEPEHPEWSPDGRSVLFGIIHAPGNPDAPQERIERVPADDATATPTVLYTPPGGGLGAAKPTYSPDGTSILFGCSMAMCVMDADGSNVAELLLVPGTELNHFTWGPVGH